MTTTQSTDQNASDLGLEQGAKSYDHLVIDQGWSDYTDVDHNTWRTLYNRQMDSLGHHMCPEYLEALDILGFSSEQIPDFREVNARLRALTGWEVIATRGLVKSKPFFDMLTDKKFPSGNFIRKPEQLDYLEEPDIFHDLLGHIPLLTNPSYAAYMNEYGKGGARALAHKTTKNLSRLNWWTIEFGLIQKPDGVKIYGAGLCSSYGEGRYCIDDPSAHHIKFDLERCMRTQVYINDFQSTYFVIDSFDDLFKQAVETDFTPLYESFKGADGKEPLSEYLPFDIVAGDEVLRVGTQDYTKPRKEEMIRSISI
jgi:phenylalanine-4-hydroxylase